MGFSLVGDGTRLSLLEAEETLACVYVAEQTSRTGDSGTSNKYTRIEERVVLQLVAGKGDACGY